MNTPTIPTPDLESLHKAVQEFRPVPHRIPFNGLKPVHDSIVELRKQNVSYAAIAELLQQHGVKTSRARVAEYGRIVLEGGKRANGENGRKPRQPQISRPRLKVRQPWQQNPHRPRQRRPLRRRAMSRRHQKKFAIPFTRTAHRQRENDESKRTGRIRGQPKIETASELTQPGKHSGDAPASPRCPARQPERLISRPATFASHTQPQKFGRRTDKPVTPP